MKKSEEITFSMVLAMWGEYLSETADRFIEKHVVLRSIRIRTACSSPLHRLLRARQRRKIEKRLDRIALQLEQIKQQRHNDFIAEGLLHADQALLQSDLRNL